MAACDELQFDSAYKLGFWSRKMKPFTFYRMLGLGLLVALPTFCVFSPLLLAQKTIMLKATTKTVACSNYNAKAAPAVHAKSGDTVEIETLITSSEAAGGSGRGSGAGGAVATRHLRPGERQRARRAHSDRADFCGWRGDRRRAGGAHPGGETGDSVCVQWIR